MARATQVLAVTTALGVVASVYLFLDNRSLRSELADRPATTALAPAAPKDTVAARTGDPWTQPDKRSAKLPTGTASTEAPALPEAPKESRLDRRQRRLQEFSAMFGRHDGETDEEYRARIGPMMVAGLAMPRMRVAEYRPVDPEESDALDRDLARAAELVRHGDVALTPAGRALDEDAGVAALVELATTDPELFVRARGLDSALEHGLIRVDGVDTTDLAELSRRGAQRDGRTFSLWLVPASSWDQEGTT